MTFQKIAIIGSGISGLSIARMLSEEGKEVTLFEKRDKIGGLVKCDRVHDNLYHKVGGHVFNSKNQEVLDWFWKYFDRGNEFLKAKRNAKIWLENQYLGYPIENYLHKLPKETVSAVLSDLLLAAKNKEIPESSNFEQFLISNFGTTLYELYFKPYNKKIWNFDLAQVPLTWLDGKLPMPNIHDILLSNIAKEEESNMVHSFFYYPKENGSQFIVDRLSEGLNVQLNTTIESLVFDGKCWIINDSVQYDAIVYCGDVRELHKICKLENAQDELLDVKELTSNGTSNIFCETDATDISWLYIPEEKFKAHRIIYTGTFSPSNNRGSDRMTCVVEFSGIQTIEFMRDEIQKLPGNLTELAHNFEPNSYVVHKHDTAAKIEHLRAKLKESNMHLLGRFAEWEYYNMDKAIERAIEIKNELLN